MPKDFIAILHAAGRVCTDLARLSRSATKLFGNRNAQPQSRKTRSRHIPQEEKDIVWRRDQGRCVTCGSNEKLEFDHIIPFSKGGSNTARNIQLLCEQCKSEEIGSCLTVRAALWLSEG